MPKLSSVCRHIRSKNAGPFCITVDLFFKDQTAFARYANASQLQPQSLGSIFGVSPKSVEHYIVPDLCVLKISFPRRDPQGGVVERDLHGGQQYARIVDLDLD
jgi:hypothetical protein